MQSAIRNLQSAIPSRWPHRLAVLLVCATFPLIWVGALVTTEAAGMAVPDWPNTYGYNLFLYPISTWLAGPYDIFIEHGHRLLGAAVGLVTISLAIALWVSDSRMWIRWLGVAAVALVVGQGLLGGFRVLLADIELAKLHGCVAPLFFALAVALAVLTSRWWRDLDTKADAPGVNRLFAASLLATILAYVQIVLGANVRHVAPASDGGLFGAALLLHIALGLLLAVQIVLATVGAWRNHRTSPRIKWPAIALVMLVLGQLLLGGASWIVNYGWPATIAEQFRWTAGWTNTAGALWQSVIVTSHVAVGSLILVTSLVLALRSARLGRYGALMTIPSGLKLRVAL